MDDDYESAGEPSPQDANLKGDTAPATGSSQPPTTVVERTGPSISHYPLNPAFFQGSPSPAQAQATMPPFPAPSPYAYPQPPVGYFGPPVVYQQPPAPAAAARTKTSKSKRATNGASTRFSKPEIDTLLDAIEDVVPIGKPAWDRVESMYNSVYEPLGRTRLMENLHKKFHSMCKETPPTGQTEMDPQVARAKAIQEDIFDKSESTIFRGDTKENTSNHPEGFVGKETQDGEVNESATETESTASRNRKPNPNRGAGGAPKSGHVKRKGNDFVEAFLATEKAAAKRERRREKARNAQMQMFMTAVASAFGGSRVAKMLQLNTEDAGSDSSSDDDDEVEVTRTKKARKSIEESDDEESEED